MYYNSTKMGIIKVDLTSDFLRKYRSMYGEKLLIKLFVLRKKIWMIKLEGEETANSLDKSVYLYTGTEDYGMLIEGIEFYVNATMDNDHHHRNDVYVTMRGRHTGTYLDREIFVDLRKDAIYYEYVCEMNSNWYNYKGHLKIKDDKIYKQRETRWNYQNKYCGLPKMHEITDTSNEETVTEEEEIYGIKYSYKAVKSNGFQADFVVYVAEQIIIGYIKREDSTDNNVKDAYFLFGKRQHHIIKGVVIGSHVHGKFYIDHDDNFSRVVIVYDNDDFRTEYYTVTDNLVHLKNDVVYNDTNQTQTLIRNWPDNYATDTWEFKSYNGDDRKYFIYKMILIKQPLPVPDYSVDYENIVYNANMNYKQMQGIVAVLVGFDKDHDNKYIMYIRNDAKYIMLRQYNDYTKFTAGIGNIEYHATNKMQFIEYKNQDWQDTYDKQVNAGSDTPTWTYASNLTTIEGTNHIWSRNAMKNITTKDLEDENVERFLHVYMADTTIMLVLERKQIGNDKSSHHYFCFGNYKTDIHNDITIEGVMASRAVSGLFKIYYSQEHSKSILEVEFKHRNTHATDQLPASDTKLLVYFDDTDNILRRDYKTTVMFDLAFHNTVRQQYLFDDVDNVLELVKTPVGSNVCNSCWNNSDVTDYDNWLSKSKYSTYQTS